MDVEKHQYIFGEKFKNHRSLQWVIYQYLYYTHQASKEDKSFYARIGREGTKAWLEAVISYYCDLRNEINNNSLQGFYLRKHFVENQLAILRNSINEEPLPMIHFGKLLLQRNEVEDLISIKSRHETLPEIEVFGNMDIEQLFEFLS